MERQSKTSQELEDEAFVKAAFVNTKQLGRTLSDKRHDIGTLSSKSNRYLKTDFASRLAQLQLSSDPEGPTTSVSPKGEGLKTETFMGRAAPRHNAAARLYEMKMHRSRVAEATGAIRRQIDPQQGCISEEESDRVSIMSVGSTPSAISEASTKILTEPLSKSTWRPLRVSRDMVGRKIQGAGLLHVAGTKDVDLSLRDTYQEPKKEFQEEQEELHVDGLELVRDCTDAKELRRLLKLTVQMLPKVDTASSIVHRDAGVNKLKPSRLDVAQRDDIFDRLKKLEKQADSEEGEKTLLRTGGDREQALVHSSSYSMKKSPEVQARFDRLGLLSKRAEQAFEGIV